jgi:hypothetical protein
MLKATITNPTIRLFHLPKRAIGRDASGKVEYFGHRVQLGPGARVVVPMLYVQALLAETNSKGKPTGWALRLEKKGEGAYVVRGPLGAAGLFEQRVLALRQDAMKAQEEARTQAQAAVDATERALDAEKRLAELEQRFAQVEAELVLAKSDGKKSDAKDSKKT